MAIVTPKMEILVDLNKPVEEIQACISAIGNSHHGKQLDILSQIDLWLGEQIIRLEEAKRNQQQTSADIAAAKLMNDELQKE